MNNVHFFGHKAVGQKMTLPRKSRTSRTGQASRLDPSFRLVFLKKSDLHIVRVRTDNSELLSNASDQAERVKTAHCLSIQPPEVTVAVQRANVYFP
jgi:hypothetical protein